MTAVFCTWSMEIFAMILSCLKISSEFYIFALSRGFRSRESAVFSNMRQKGRVGGKRENPLVFVISRCSICPSCRISFPLKIIGIEDAGKKLSIRIPHMRVDKKTMKISQPNFPGPDGRRRSFFLVAWCLFLDTVYESGFHFFICWNIFWKIYLSYYYYNNKCFVPYWIFFLFIFTYSCRNYMSQNFENITLCLW